MFSVLVEQNMIPLYYFASINCLFGLVSMFIAIVARFGPDGAECAKEGIQTDRALYLTLHILCLIVYMATMFHHMLWFRLNGPVWCNDVYNEEDEEEDD